MEVVSIHSHHIFFLTPPWLGYGPAPHNIPFFERSYHHRAGKLSLTKQQDACNPVDFNADEALMYTNVAKAGNAYPA